MNKANDIPDGSIPPMQNDLGVFSSTPYGCSPFYKFVTIAASKGGINVWESLPFFETEEFDGAVYVEDTTESYSVHVPKTTPKEGESVTEFAIQNRKRTVPVTKRTHPEGAEEQFVERSYTVCIPYSEVIDGVPVARSRLETRTRLVSENEIPKTLAPMLHSKWYACESLSFYDVQGKELNADDVLEGLDGFTPLIQIAAPKHIVPYFTKVLQPETRFLVLSPTSNAE